MRASLELQIVGLERRATIREGDLSHTGLYLRLDAEVGEPGAVHALRLRSRDRAIRLEVPARVVRVERSDDLLSGSRVSGAAFELLFYEPGKREEVAALLAHVMREQQEALQVSALSLETAWQLRKGERVRVEVPSPCGETVRFEGRAVRSRRHARGGYRTRVHMRAEPAPPPTAPEAVGIRDALSEPPDAPAPLRARPVHLEGELAHLAVPAVLSIATLERFTGELHLRQGLDFAQVFLRDGQVVDCEGPRDDLAPRQALAELCRWSRGRFELSLGPCARPDRLGVPTTALLLDLARADDEAKRVA